MSGKGGGSPTVRRRRLGAELRRHRDSTGLTIDIVAAKMGCSSSKISRVETGLIGASPRDVREMLELYHVSESETAELVELARQTRERGWWQRYGAVLTGAYVGFEAAAKSIRSFEAQCVPGLLQTEEYARCLIRQGRPDLSPADVLGRVRVRMARQALLTQDDPVDFWCVLDEAVLLRTVGGNAVMRRQLEHLSRVIRLGNVTLHVLPLRAGAHAAMEGSFVMLEFADEADADTVYVGMATGGVFQEKPEELRIYDMIFRHLVDIALPVDESAARIVSIAKELT